MWTALILNMKTRYILKQHK